MRTHEDQSFAIILILVGALLLGVALALLSDRCILGEACEDFWRAPATMTAEARATYGAEQFHLQLTTVAGEP